MRDEVDRLLAAWQRERPELDVGPLAVLSRVSRLSRHLDIARRAVFAAHGLEAYEFDVLTSLRRAGPPYELSPGDLLRQTLVTSGTMTNRIDRLQERGLVRRRANPADGRGVRVRLTAAGRRAVDAAFDDLLGRERELLRVVSARAQRELGDVLAAILAGFDVPDGASVGAPRRASETNRPRRAATTLGPGTRGRRSGSRGQ